ncbi:MAG: universal stress protein [Cyclobacteriaceae bacterium]|nr:universal stress protein [Cyclobacteriaceae bacterium]
MKNILCPIDFSEASIHALEFAADIGALEQGRLTLLNIFTPSEFNKILGSQHVGEDYDKLLQAAELKLEAIAKEIMHLSGKKGLMECRHMIRSGEIVVKVSEVAKEEECDLIVIGTTGTSAFKKKYIGDNATDIIQQTHCSVMCIPESHNFHGINRIVYASDYQEEDKLAVQQIVRLAASTHAELKIVHISHHDHAIDKAMYDAFVSELSGFIRYDRTTFDRLVFDHVAEGLDKYAREIEADLLILLDKKLTKVEHLLHRSLTHHIDKFTDYPLLILKL